MTDIDLDIPDFLRVTPEEAARRKQWWINNPPKAMAIVGGRDMTETQKRYYESIERERAIKKELDRPRLAALRARKAAEKAELDEIKLSAKKAHRRRRR